LSHVGCFGDKATQDQVAKTQGDIAPHKTPAHKPLTNGTPRTSIAQKGTYMASTSTQPPANQKADNKNKGTVAEEDKETLADPNDLNKNLQIS
jgi:hypothetical protein